jgi:hypothetical protein
MLKVASSIVPLIPSPPAPLNLPKDYDQIPSYLTDLGYQALTFVLGTYAGKDVLVIPNHSIELEHDENDPEAPSQMSSCVYVGYAGLLLDGIIIGHIVGTSTGLIVAENGQFFLYSPVNGEHGAWDGVGLGTVVNLSFDGERNMRLSVFGGGVTVTEDTDDF